MGELQPVCEKKEDLLSLGKNAFDVGANFNGDGFRLSRAKNDVEAAQAWLSKYQDKPKTFANYRKEVERFLIWANARGQSISALSVEDIEEYKRFLSAPGSEWINPISHARNHPEWKPFRGPLSPESTIVAIRVLSAMFQYMVTIGHLRANTIAAAKLLGKQRTSAKVTRYLHDALIGTLYEQIVVLTTNEILQARNKWLLTLLYLTGMRISESLTNDMGCFRYERTRSGDKVWYLKIVGKGDKTREIPVSKKLLSALVEYRTAMGHPPYPNVSESLPLVQSVRGSAASPITRQAAHHALKQIFESVIHSCDDAQDREALAHASAHWLRHSRGSHLVNAGVKLNTVREIFGHSDLSTTSMYVHGEKQAMHDEISDVDG